MSDLDLIKELREKTGAGFLDCKNALKENNDDINLSIDSLRKKGLAKANKKSSRETNEGAVGFYSDKNLTVILKVNSETDFCAKSDTFLDFVDILGNAILNANDSNMGIDDFLSLNIEGKTISDLLTEMIAKIGENIVVTQLIISNVENINFNFYVHNPYRNNIGKIISSIFFSSEEMDEGLNKFSKNLCMHIAASKPEAIDIESLPNDVIENEKKIQQEMILESGKPSNVVNKILEGKMRKFYSEVTLLNQNYVLDTDKTIQEVIKAQNETNNFVLKNYNLVSL